MTVGNKKYDAFISYRRTGGSAEARLVQTKLSQHGLRAFLDVDDLESGHFNLALLERIAEAPNFIVILSPHALDRVVDERDWLRQEIAQAVQTKRNIVPLLMPGFDFPAPETLPAEFKDLPNYQSVKYSHEFFDATIAKLVQYLQPARSRRLWWLSLGLVVVIVMGLALAASIKFWPHKQGIAAQGHWMTFPPLPTARAWPMAASVGTMLCVVGGINHNGDLPTLEINNIGTGGSWQSKAPMPKLDPALEHPDRSMILDTHPAEIKDWHAGRYQGSVAVVGGKLYLIGGWRTIPPYPSSLLFMYDPPTNTWSTKEPMPIMSGCSSAGVVDGKIYVLTPCDGHPGIYNFLYVYDPVTNTWVNRDPAPHQHAGAAAGVIEGKFYVVGGIDGSNGYSAAVDVFNPATGTWSARAPMPTARSELVCGVINGKLYAAGGANERGALAVLEVYDPVTDTWRTEAPMPTARRNAAAAVIDDKLYVVGGTDAQLQIVSTVEVFTP
jgi:N-acetylneuraminic acid mutarotase